MSFSQFYHKIMKKLYTLTIIGSLGRDCVLIVENKQKETINFYFKPRFSVKPSKFQIYFANDCRLY